MLPLCLGQKFSNFSLFSIVCFKKNTYSNRKLKTKNSKAILYLPDKYFFVAMFRSVFFLLPEQLHSLEMCILQLLSIPILPGVHFSD